MVASQRVAQRAARGWARRAHAAPLGALPPPEARPAGSSPLRLVGGAAALLAGAACVAWARQPSPAASRGDGEAATLTNWSSTHEVTTSRYFQPESVEELEALVARAHAQRRRLRPVGSGLSPNGLGFSADGMVNLGLCDKACCVRPSHAAPVADDAPPPHRCYTWTPCSAG